MNSSISTQLSLLSQLSPECLEKSGNLLIKIFGNIIKHPNDLKYRNLNFIKISNKLQKSKICIDLLFTAGFEKANDDQNHQRLILDDNKSLNTLILLHKNLLLIMITSQNITEYKNSNINDDIDNDRNNTIQQLIDHGYTVAEAEKAINMSLSTNTNSNNMESSGINKLISMGFDKAKSIMAMTQCNNNVHEATEYLLTLDSLLPRLLYSLRNRSLQKRIHLDCIAFKQCHYANEFVETMKKYEKFETEDVANMNHDDKTRIAALDCYHHLISQHDSNEAFEFIVERLGYCDIEQCDKMRRNYRPKHIVNDDEKDNLRLSIKDKVYVEIMDKMHCYFYHRFDIGFRVKSAERIEVKTEEDMALSNKSIFIPNAERLNIIQSLKSRKPIGSLQFNTYSKFNQLQNNHEINQPKNHSFYSYGYKFMYKDRREISVIQINDAIVVSQKYDSLKDEVTQNKIVQITQEQFQKEYQKASDHFESHYRKTMFERHFVLLELSIEYILTLMLYCNFTLFQYEFTKTYRENDGKDHDNFFCMGRNLQKVLSINGAAAKYVGIKSFFHGIAQKLLFPYKNNDIRIYCPLSTTSTFAVAMNFVDNNNGWIVEFTSTDEYCKCFAVSWLSDFASECEYLFINTPYSGTDRELGLCLSDLCSEELRDCILRDNNSDLSYIGILAALQSGTEFSRDYMKDNPYVNDGTLCVSDIIDPQSGITYSMMYSALKYMDSILFDVNIQTDSNKLTELMKALIVQIILDYARMKSMKHRSTIGMDEYAMKLVSEYFQNKSKVTLGLEKKHQSKWVNCEVLYKLVQESNTVNLDLIFSIFRNIKELNMNFFTWNKIAWERVISDVGKFNSQTLNEVWYCKINESAVGQIDQIISRYNPRLREQSLRVVAMEQVVKETSSPIRLRTIATEVKSDDIKEREGSRRGQCDGIQIGLLKYDDNAFLKYLIKSERKIHFNDEDGTLERLLDEYIKEKRMREEKHPDLDGMQLTLQIIRSHPLEFVRYINFNGFCKLRFRLHIYSNSLLLKLLHHDHPYSCWIKMENVFELFAPLNLINVYEVALDSYIFEDILQFLSKRTGSWTKTGVQEIVLIPQNIYKTNIKLLLSQYKKKFKDLGFRICVDEGDCIIIERRANVADVCVF